MLTRALHRDVGPRFSYANKALDAVGLLTVCLTATWPVEISPEFDCEEIGHQAFSANGPDDLLCRAVDAHSATQRIETVFKIRR